MTEQEPAGSQSAPVNASPRQTLVEQVGRKLASFDRAEGVFDAPEGDVLSQNTRFDYIDKARAVLTTVDEHEQDQVSPHNQNFAPRVEAGAKALYESSTGHVWGSKPEFMPIWRHHAMVTLIAAEESDTANSYHRVKVDAEVLRRVAEAIEDHHEEGEYQPSFGEDGYIVTSNAAVAVLEAIGIELSEETAS